MSLDAIAELWLQNKPMSEIGDELGMTRSRVAGLINRARKTDPRFASRPRPPKVTPLPKVRKVKSVDEAADNVLQLPPRPRLLIDLGPRDCRWAVGEAADGRHLMCGRPQVSGRPYCATHAARTAGASATGAKFVLRAIAARSR